MPSERDRQPGGQEADGGDAARPSDIPARGWLDVVKRTRKEIKDDNVTLIAAGVAFYSMLAIFPALIAVVTIYGLVAEPTDVQRQVASFAESMPPGAGDLLTAQLDQIVRTSQRSLSIALAISLAAALWSASAGTQSLIKGLNIIYDEQESRGFVKLRGLALVLTIGAMVVALGALALIAVAAGGAGRARPAGAPASWPSPSVAGRPWSSWSRSPWPCSTVSVPTGPTRGLHWMSWGAVVAIVLWVVVSAGFSFYVSNFGSYGQTYGSLGAVIVLLLWLWLSALAVLIGAELDAEIEREAVRHTTSPESPTGERDATADPFGESPRR